MINTQMYKSFADLSRITKGEIIHTCILKHTIGEIKHTHVWIHVYMSVYIGYTIIYCTGLGIIFSMITFMDAIYESQLILGSFICLII